MEGEWYGAADAWDGGVEGVGGGECCCAFCGGERGVGGEVVKGGG